ncbi:uncharacterized protein ATNIH1004_003021 [Aspergillus tanneri]|uniref:Arrestin-like N-terminal domain-containing protein n=1 Tax=Aspergillus tanneri TaxID=1220188 RepID=A0A5M9N6V2_9EURO|nr:uncharacterized protein ATNIH1004_003021 [Aspergillus tanneri]KAA8650337.1 hypothetical protein ATNIH1004_003021 [Aspergillus tanneri]
MTAPSILSNGSDMVESFRRYGLDISIDLVNSALDGATYLTDDRIEGTVTLTAKRECQFDQIGIAFEGTSKTSIPRATVFTGQTGARHKFLKLRQPIDENEYPASRTLSPDQKYKFNFVFVVPGRLLPQSCSHETDHVHMKEAHLRTPPTLGDPITADDRQILDDMAPETCQISYGIRVLILRKSRVNDQRVLGEATRKVRILPALDSLQLPLNESSVMNEKCATLKTRFTGHRLGDLVLSTAEPRPILLSPPQYNASNAAPTAVEVQVRYRPDSDEPPPRLDTIRSKLEASTLYTAEPWKDYPPKHGAMTFTHTRRATALKSIPLSSFSLKTIKWVKSTSHDCYTTSQATGPIPRTECFSDSSLREGTYYTTSITVPITLPSSKDFVPTFHSCLISRIYTIDLSLSFNMASSHFITRSVSLQVPTQIIYSRTHEITAVHPKHASGNIMGHSPTLITTIPSSLGFRLPEDHISESGVFCGGQKDYPMPPAYLDIMRGILPP